MNDNYFRHKTAEAMREIKRRQNKNPAARTVAESIRAQALAMDRKGDVSHSVLFFLLRVPKLSSARNTVEEELNVVLQLYTATLKLFLCRLFSCFALFCPHPTFHYMQLRHRHPRPMCGCPGSPMDMAFSRPHVGLWRTERPDSCAFCRDSPDTTYPEIRT